MKVMKKYIKLIAGCLLAGAMAACSDAPDELTNVDYDRLFSPTELSVRVRNQVNATITWKAVDKAAGYTVEVYDNEALEGTPVKEAQVTENTVTFSELPSDSKFWVRVKATGSAVPESKWVSVDFKTDSENIFQNVASDDITANSVTLRWEAGKTATEITLTPGDITHNVTADEVAAGAATITGLKSETTYTAVLKNGTATRGTVSFTTQIDLGDAVILRATADEAALTNFFASIEEGTSVCLLPAEDGTNTFPAVKISLPKGCTIMGLAAQPVVCGLSFLIEPTASSVTLKDLTFDNTGAAENFPLVDYTGSQAGANLTIENCVVKGTYKNLLAETNSAEAAMGVLTVKNCVMTGISGRAIDFQKKKINFQTVNISNSTFYEMCSGQDFIRFDYAAGREGAVYNVENNTFYNVKASSKGIAYIRSNKAGDKAFTCKFNKNVFAYDADVVNVFFSADSKSDNILFADNYYFNATSLVSTAAEGGKAYDTAGTVLTATPYTDAAAGNFKLTDEDMSYKQIGDPRWF